MQQRRLGDVSPLSSTCHSSVGNPYWMKWYWEGSFKKWDTTQRTSCILQIREMTRLPLPPVCHFYIWKSVQIEIIPTAGSREVPLAGVGNSEHSSRLFCYFKTLLQTSARKLLTPVSGDGGDGGGVETAKNAVNSFLFLLHVFFFFFVCFVFVVEIFKYETHLKSSCSYRGSIPTLEWSH